MSKRDENDRHRDGTLPTDPLDGTQPIQIDKARARKAANDPKPKAQPAKVSPPEQLERRRIAPLLSIDVRTNAPHHNVANALTVLVHDSRWKNALAYDERRVAHFFVTAPPWHADYDDNQPRVPREIGDRDDARFATWLQREHGFAVPTTVAKEALEAAASRRRVDAVRSYLEALTWDGGERIGTWLVRHAHALDTDYVRAVSSRWLIAAVARALSPGCQVDSVLILEGRQGLRKSGLFRTIIGDDWFTDRISDLRSKDAAADLQGVWCVELAELDALDRSEVTAVKAFVTRRDDRFRPAYARRVASHPRRCVFAGTTNQSEYLRDATGGRRWWPVACEDRGPFDLDALAAERDQLWAEAVARYRAGAPWHLETDELEKAAGAEQEERYEADAWEPRIASYLRTLTVEFVGTLEILEGALKLKAGDVGRAEQTRIGKAMQRIEGWERARESVGGAQVRGYKRAPK